MLVLSRKKNERINLLGIDVVITVVEILGNRVRLGISAPPEVEIVRGSSPAHGVIETSKEALRPTPSTTTE